MLRMVAHRVTYDAIDTMLSLEVPNLHELDLAIVFMSLASVVAPVSIGMEA
jgi:hypothetical protein